MDAHIIDSRGVYLRTETVDPMGPQPAGAVYETLPGEKSGETRVWDGLAWQQVANADVPPVPEPPGPGPGPVPEEVTMAQCRLALYDLHQIKTDDQFYELADLLPEGKRERALLELRTRPTVRYDNQLVIAFCTSMGWDRDALFVYGAAQ